MENEIVYHVIPFLPFIRNTDLRHPFPSLLYGVILILYAGFHFQPLPTFKTMSLPSVVGIASEESPRYLRVSRFCSPYMLRNHFLESL